MKLFFALASVALSLTAMSSVADEFDSAGVKIHYAVQGRGDPVILIHGLYSSGRMNWDMPGTSALIAKHFQVITLDCRGHGRSDKPEAANAYGTNMVEDVVRLMDHLNIKQARLAGYSMGGMISMKLAVTHPERVTAVVLGGMGWLKSGALLNSVWDNVNRSKFNVPASCLPIARCHRIRNQGRENSRHGDCRRERPMPPLVCGTVARGASGLADSHYRGRRTHRLCDQIRF